ncbi:hypothetical protein ACC685_33470 [Rhizobium ruizarguesonis]
MSIFSINSMMSKSDDGPSHEISKGITNKDRKVLVASYGGAKRPALAEVAFPVITERFELHNGPEQPDALEIGKDLSAYALSMVPWAEFRFAPRVIIKTQTGERAEVSSAVIYQWEVMGNSTLPQKVAYILISSKLPRRAALQEVFRCGWNVLEAEADRAYTREAALDEDMWSAGITASIVGGMDIAKLSPDDFQPSRRETAFVTFADAVSDGNSIVAIQPHEAVFAAALNGSLGRRLIAHLNPFE